MRITPIVLLLSIACGGTTPAVRNEDEPAVAPLSPIDQGEAHIGLSPEVDLNSGEGEGEEAPSRDGAPYPIILVHGFSGFTDLGPVDYFFRVQATLAEEGTLVYTPALPPYNDSIDRATSLAAHIDRIIDETNKAKVHLIAHSQGGIDVRRVLAMGYQDRIASVITIASPHHGTKVANVAMAAPEGVLNPMGQFLAFLIGARDAPGDGEDVDGVWEPDLADAITTLSTEGAAAFNAENPLPEGLPFYSVAAYSNLQAPPALCDAAMWTLSNRRDALDPLLLGPAAVVSGLSFTENDGLVSTESAVFGELLACIPADHFDEIGQIADFAPGLLSGFNHLDFYRDLVAFARGLE